MGQCVLVQYIYFYKDNRFILIKNTSISMAGASSLEIDLLLKAVFSESDMQFYINHIVINVLYHFFLNVHF